MTPARVLGPGGLLHAAFPAYEHRPAQLAMAERIAQAIRGDEALLVEAGTGTGKTLAYLIPAILSGRKTIVSTATKTLQEQIARVDLPRLARVLPRPFRFAVMKGLGNYVCRRRLEAFERQTSLVPDPAFVQLRRFVDRTATGDRADVPDLPDDSSTWREIASAPETRLGLRCPHHERCFVTAMRRAGAEADLVITNHHLFFADLALRSAWPDAEVLPPYETVVFDEAHQLEDIAAEFFGTHVSTQRLLGLARDLARARVVEPERAAAFGGRLSEATAGFGEAVRGAVPSTRVGVGGPRGGRAAGGGRGDDVRALLPEGLWTGAVRPRYHALDQVLEDIAIWLDPDGPTVEAAGDHAPELGALARRAQSLRSDLASFADARPTAAGAGLPGSAGHVDGNGRGGQSDGAGSMGADRSAEVRWLVTNARGAVGLHSAPIDVGPRLAAAFAAHPGPAIFTSATLTVAGSFAYVRQRLGLHDTADEASFPSPFHYDRQALLYVAADLPEPNAEGFVAEAAERVAELCHITSGRALILFTSFRNLHAVAAALGPKVPFPLLIQGQRPRHVLLDALRTNLGSILLATQSFWEGVDVPGEALSLVVMDRLPFAVPDEPLTAARLAQLRSDGQDPFGSYQLPRATLALKQGFGRLIRSRGDVGIVALLDGRILRRGYGATLLASLPATCPRTESLADVAAFWARVRPAASTPGDDSHGGGGP
jgi:ATP-dependent DNA helicase DinG